MPGEKPKVTMTLEDESGARRYLSVEDDLLVKNGLDIGSVWTEDGNLSAE